MAALKRAAVRALRQRARASDCVSMYTRVLRVVCVYVCARAHVYVMYECVNRVPFFLSACPVVSRAGCSAPCILLLLARFSDACKRQYFARNVYKPHRPLRWYFFFFFVFKHRERSGGAPALPARETRPTYIVYETR